MSWIIGIDGGGTKTVACAADLSGRLLARIEKGAANYHVIGLSAFAALVAGIVDDLAEAAGCDRSALALVSLGLAGADRDRDRELLGGALSGLGCPCLIGSDARIALAAGLGDREEGIVLIAGTGSIAYGRTRRGEIIRAGGWGHLVSDEGSGYDIGRQAIARGLKAAEGREIPSLLLDRIIDSLGVADIAGLIAFLHSPATAKADIAALAATVAALAAEGDKLAAAVIADAAVELAGLVASVVARGFPGAAPGAAPVPVAAYGGLLLGCPALRERLAGLLAGQAELLPPGPEPVMGALKIGYDYLKSLKAGS
ncbi:BadF/BadG/BcrA/BcrD ATPase family protein [Anaeroselena agilis]|uniref:BadF/BadG/BcrA/BcrD ATPase family protein n=1 Tax=Anaeroselena agilis TaxID=3063788 RepID=A0ABU3NY44_9FIRM|nr:BadF/BadG/BcrA/BcrD ATPase family protein [Selenomonadales bacterium 4137-cl]